MEPIGLLSCRSYQEEPALLHLALRRSRYQTTRAFGVAVILIVLGVIGTFPTFFQRFE